MQTYITCDLWRGTRLVDYVKHSKSLQRFGLLIFPLQVWQTFAYYVGICCVSCRLESPSFLFLLLPQHLTDLLESMNLPIFSDSHVPTVSFLASHGNPHGPLQQLSNVWRQQALWKSQRGSSQLSSLMPLSTSLCPRSLISREACVSEYLCERKQAFCNQQTELISFYFKDRTLLCHFTLIFFFFFFLNYLFMVVLGLCCFL